MVHHRIAFAQDLASFLIQKLSPTDDPVIPLDDFPEAIPLGDLPARKGHPCSRARSLPQSRDPTIGAVRAVFGDVVEDLVEIALGSSRPEELHPRPLFLALSLFLRRLMHGLLEMQEAARRGGLLELRRFGTQKGSR